MNHGSSALLSTVSLTLAVAATAMWVRSHDTEDEHRYISEVAGQDTYLYVISYPGQLAIKVTPEYPPEPPDQSGATDWRWCREYEQRDRLFSGGRSSYQMAGIGIEAGEDVLFDYFGTEVTCRGYAVAVPYLGLALVFSVLPARYLVRHVRRRYRRANSLCVECGYDLRASSGRCPECGRAFAQHTGHRRGIWKGRRQTLPADARREFRGGGVNPPGIL